MVCGLGVTDLRWHGQMLAEQPAGLVNFWTPTPWNFNFEAEARFGFMLKAPVRKVGGFGTFVRYEELTVDDAWRQWGPANGVATLEELRARIVEFTGRRSILPLPHANPIIGCILLSDCVFLDEEEQFSPEEIGLSFPPQIVKWKRFAADLTLPIERDLPSIAAPFALVGVPDEDWEVVRRRKRLAQPLFRRDVVNAYGGRCALTGSDCPDALEAAHIQPFRSLASHHVQNGIALRRDIHRLFDAGLLTLETDGTVLLSSQLRGTSYASLTGMAASFPKESGQSPSAEALRFHRAEVFRP